MRRGIALVWCGPSSATASFNSTRHPGAPLLRLTVQHDHAAGHDLHHRADETLARGITDGFDDDWTAVTVDGKRTAQFEHPAWSPTTASTCADRTGRGQPGPTGPAEAERMKLGVFGINRSPRRSGPTARLAGLCEELGYESWWAGEHVVLPSPPCRAGADEPDRPILDPLVHLVRGRRTQRMLLGTGSSSAATQPARAGKQIATLDVLSGGRFVFGSASGTSSPSECDGVHLASGPVALTTTWARCAPSGTTTAPSRSPPAHLVQRARRSTLDPACTIPIVVGGDRRCAPSLRRAGPWLVRLLSVTRESAEAGQAPVHERQSIRPPVRAGRLENQHHAPPPAPLPTACRHTPTGVAAA